MALDFLTEGSFEKDQEGRTLFYPHGQIGSAYVVDSRRKKQLATLLKVFYLATFAAIMFFLLVLERSPLILLLVLLPGYEIPARVILRRCQRIAPQATLAQRARTMGAQQGPLFAALFTITNALLFIGFAILAVLAMDLRLQLTSAAGALVFGALLWLTILMLQGSLASRRK